MSRGSWNFGTSSETTITSCKARDAKRKGKVERPFRQLQETFLPEVELDGVPTDLADLNRRAERWLDTRVHGITSRSTGERPADRLVVERPFLTPLPRVRFDTDYVDAVALATIAVEAGYRGYFTTADNMCKTLIRAQHDGTLATKLKTYTAPTVMIIDDVGLLPIGGTEGAAMFFHVVNTRYEKGHPTLVTTNRGLPAWGQIFGDAVVAAAILDRLMHKAIVFNIRGPSWRLREHNGLEIATTNPDR